MEKSVKRAHPRVQARIEAKLKMPGGRTIVTGQILNISLGGLFIEMEEPLGFGKEFDLEFKLPDSTLHCRGLVVWSTRTQPQMAEGRSGIGVRLMKIDVSEMRQLESYISAHLETNNR